MGEKILKKWGNFQKGPTKIGEQYHLKRMTGLLLSGPIPL